MLNFTENGLTYRGTRIRVGNSYRSKLNEVIEVLTDIGFSEIDIPIIQYQSTFESKVGEENNNMMYRLTDRGNRELCLAPEYTAVVQKLALNRFKYEKDVKLFYVQECFRGERPQRGRYRQFKQVGVEILNPTKDYTDTLITLSSGLVELFTNKYEVSTQVTRGLDYYAGGEGFEIKVDELGGAKQVCGGGSYEGGIGFALGFDRLMLTQEE